LALKLWGDLRRSARLFFDLAGFKTLLEQFETDFPELPRTVLEIYTPELVTETLRRLLAEQVSISNLHRIGQALVDFDTITVDENEYMVFDPRLPVSNVEVSAAPPDSARLAAFVRSKLKRYLTQKYTRGSNSLSVYLLDPEIERLLTNQAGLPPEEAVAAIDPMVSEEIMAPVRRAFAGLVAADQMPVFLTPTSVRPVFWELIRGELPDAVVLAHRELTPNTSISVLGKLIVNLG
jgi:type III secretion protein V